MDERELNIINVGLLVIMILVALVFVFMFIDLSTQKVMGYRTTECYDRYSNEIEGLTCEEEVRCGIISRAISKDYCYKDVSDKRRKKDE